MKVLNLSTSFFARTAVVLFIVGVLSLAVIAQSGGIKGKVRNNRGDGIAGATITVRQDGKDLKTVRSDAKGNFELTGIRSGTYNVVFDANGYSSGVLYAVKVEGGVRDLGTRLVLGVDQGTQVIVRGSVFYREGTSVTGAKVELELVNSDGSTKSLGSAYTNISGDFSFRRPEGAAKLRVTAKFKGVSGSKEIDVTNAAIYRTAITLDISRT
ncbi:MAG: carboxypeptidase regulatory-like domain-containing protein, partial [Blastocatellia bacterium]